MIKIPPRHYTTIGSPVLLDEDGKPARDKYSNYKLRHGDIEVRTSTTNPEPFPLYPGEVVEQTITKLIVVEKNQALRLRATRDFTEDVDGIGSRPAQRVGDSDDVLSLSDNDDGASDAAEVKRCAGDEWLFIGPATYIPRVEVVIVGTVSSVIVKMNSALRLRALRETRGKKAGAEYLVRRSGHYLPSVDEEIVEMVDSHIITEKLALRLSAEKQFTDVYGITRKAGDEWLVTADLADYHIPDVYESVRAKVPILTLTNRQYCVILDPYVDGEQKLGTKKVVKGEVSFFLLPGETLENEVEEVYVLAEDEALLLQSVESFEDGDSKRASGERWMLQGPIEYIPPVQAKVLERRVALPLDANEGVYVRDLTTGQVRAVIGETYMLKANEELWEKELPLEVEALLEAQKLGNTYLPPMGAVASAIGGGARSKVKERNHAVREKRGFRDKTQVVKFRVPHNCAIQLYNYKSKASRISFGPDMIMLMPDEQFSVMSLSGDKPKRPNVIKSLALQLGPDFMTTSWSLRPVIMRD
jgi:major vault protein